MEDVKMAEEYVDSILNKDDAELDKFLDEYLGDLKLTKKQAGALLGIIKGIGISSFLIALKVGSQLDRVWHEYDAGEDCYEDSHEGRWVKREIEWHDLRKDPNDLPKVNQKVLLQIKNEDEPIMDFYRQDGMWNFANKYEVIAWRDLPKFEEADECQIKNCLKN